MLLIELEEALKKGQKNFINAGIEKVQQEDYAIWAALSSEVILYKIMLMITDPAIQKSLQNSLSQVAEFFDPGYQTLISKLEELKKRVDKLNPSLIYFILTTIPREAEDIKILRCIWPSRWQKAELALSQTPEAT